MRANAKRSRSFVRPAMFDLQLEWTVGVGGGGGEKRNRYLHSPSPTPLLYSFPQPSAAIKIKDGGLNICYEIT